MYVLTFPLNIFVYRFFPEVYQYLCMSGNFLLDVAVYMFDIEKKIYGSP